MKNQIIHKQSSKAGKTKIQQKYQKLLEDIEIRKKHQENLEAGMRIAMPKIDAELRPLIREEKEWHRKRLIRLDEVADELKIGKFNKEWFDGYMTTEIGEILSDFDNKDEVLKALYKKYSGEDFEIDDEGSNLIAQMMKEQFGLDIDVEEMMEKGMEAYMAENAESFVNQIQEKLEKDSEGEQRKKTPKQLAKESKQEEENKLLEQDAKAIYMRLIKKYHPDRTQDTSQQKEFTDITMKVTKAYQENDFLQLLRLQIEYIEEGENDASDLAEDMLKRYNKILEKQLREINQELENMKFNSMGLFEDFFDKNHKFSLAKFNRYKKNLEQDIQNIQIDLEDSKKRKKGWFKDWMAEIKAVTQQSMLQNIFAQMFQR